MFGNMAGAMAGMGSAGNAMRQPTSGMSAPGLGVGAPNNSGSMLAAMAPRYGAGTPAAAPAPGMGFMGGMFGGPAQPAPMAPHAQMPAPHGVPPQLWSQLMSHPGFMNFLGQMRGGAPNAGMAPAPQFGMMQAPQAPVPGLPNMQPFRGPFGSGAMY